MALDDVLVNAQGDERVLRRRDSFLRIGKLGVQERLDHAQGLLLVLVPAVAAESQVVRGAGVSQRPGALRGQHPRLADIRVVLRLQPPGAELVVVLVRRDIGGICLHLLDELDGALPDCVQFRCGERRVAFRGALQEQVMGLVADAVLLQHPPGEVGHGVVPRALHNGAAAGGRRVVILRRIVQVGDDLVHGQKALVPEHLVLADRRAEHEPPGVQGVPVKEGVLPVQRPLDGRDLRRALARGNGRMEVETGPCRQLALGEHIVAARRGGELNVAQVGVFRQLLRRQPFCRVFRVVVVNVHLDDRRFHEILIAAVVVQIPGGDMVKGDRLGKLRSVGGVNLMRVPAVGGVARAVRCVNGQLHLITSVLFDASRRSA